MYFIFSSFDVICLPDDVMIGTYMKRCETFSIHVVNVSSMIDQTLKISI